MFKKAAYESLAQGDFENITFKNYHSICCSTEMLGYTVITIPIMLKQEN